MMIIILFLILSYTYISVKVSQEVLAIVYGKVSTKHYNSLLLSTNLQVHMRHTIRIPRPHFITPIHIDLIQHVVEMKPFQIRRPSLLNLHSLSLPISFYFCRYVCAMHALVITHYICMSISQNTSWSGLFNQDSERIKEVLKEDIRQLRIYPIAYLAMSMFPLINRFFCTLFTLSPHSQYYIFLSSPIITFTHHSYYLTFFIL